MFGSKINYYPIKKLSIPSLDTDMGATYFCLRKAKTIIGLGEFHFCVRNGNRWDISSIAPISIPKYFNNTEFLVKIQVIKLKDLKNYLRQL